MWDKYRINIGLECWTRMWDKYRINIGLEYGINVGCKMIGTKFD